MNQHLLLTFLIWFPTFLLGGIFVPFSRLFFKKFSDEGYFIAKIVGIFTLSYLLFLASTVHILPLSLWSIIVLILLMTAGNIYLFTKVHDKRYISISWKKIALIELFYFLLLFGFSFFKSFEPAIYEIERFMDFGFIETLRNSMWLPVEDMWFAGDSLNYYYFGHFVGFVLLTLSNLDSLPGFFMLQSWIFSTASVAIFLLAKDITHYCLSLGKLIKKSRWWNSFAGGLLSLYATIFAGTLYMTKYAALKAAEWMGIETQTSAGSFFYPEPTRAIDGTITEMPFYSFVVADLHAHVWGILTGLVVVSVLFALWLGRKNGEPAPNNLHLWLLAFFLGVSYMANSWDALTLGILSVVFLWFAYPNTDYRKRLIAGGVLAVLAYVIALPWSLFIDVPVQGVGIVTDQSALWSWFSYWGTIVLVAASYFLLRRILKKRDEDIDILNYMYIVVGVALSFIGALEIVYMKDILQEGEWFRANTVFKISIQTWVWVGTLTGPILVLLFYSLKNKLTKAFLALMVMIVAVVVGTYPVIATKQALIGTDEPFNIDKGLAWWESKYPDDFTAYRYLKSIREELPSGDKKRYILEAEGDSYTDVSRFSVFLGWPTVVGWPVHEWTWHGSYDAVGARRGEVKEVYTGEDIDAAKRVLEKYDIDYIIVGEVEYIEYGDGIKPNKLRSLGETVFEKGNVFIVQVSK